MNNVYLDIEDVKETVHAHWLHTNNGFYCSYCMEYLPQSINSFDIVKFNWCPSCGSKMDEFD